MSQGEAFGGRHDRLRLENHFAFHMARDRSANIVNGSADEEQALCVFVKGKSKDVD